MANFNVLIPMLIFYIAFFGILGLIGVGGYLFKGFGMFGIAKRMGIRHAWLAFIPVASNYLQGELAGEIQLGKKKIRKTGLWMLLIPILFYVVFMTLYLIMMFSILVPVITSSVSKVSEEWIAANVFGGLFSWLGIVMVIAIAGSAIMNVAYALVRYQTHRKFVAENMAILHMILGLLVPLYQPIYYFILSRKPFLQELQQQQEIQQ